MTAWPQHASCQCGDLSVAALHPPRSTVACHCRDCQRRSGSAFGVGVVFNAADIEVTSRNAIAYDRFSDAGEKVTQRFCGTCGTTVLWQAEVHPGLLVVAGGAFADTTWIKPAFHAWTVSGHDWFSQTADLPKYNRTPWQDDAGAPYT